MNSKNIPKILLKIFASIKLTMILPTMAPPIPKIPKIIAYFQSTKFFLLCMMSAVMDIGIKNIKFMPWANVCGKFSNNVKYIMNILPPPKPIAAKTPESIAAILDSA